MSQPGYELEPPVSEVDKRSEWVEPLKFSKVLGAGSYGVVLKATDRLGSTTSACAVKIIFSEYSTDPDLKDKEREKILREVRTVADKRHENIVATTNFAEKALGPEDIAKIFEGMQLEERLHDMKAAYLSKATRFGGLDTIWIQMQLCGRNLRTCLTESDYHYDHRHELPRAQVDIVRGLVAGLTYLHDNKIMHRDFKPENIYCGGENSLLPIKIGDFGLSRELLNDCTLTSKVGTSDYRAPEASSRDYSFQADLYSLGLVIWEVVQKISNNERKSLFDRLVNDREESLVKGHPLIHNCQEVVVKLTRRKVEKRTQSILHVNFQIWKFRARNSEELKQRLKIAEPGDIIGLDEGEYLGPFDIKQNMIILWGGGPGTIIINQLEGTTYDLVAGIKITGQGCEILCVKVICQSNKGTIGIELAGSGSKLQDIEFEGGGYCIKARGYEHSLSNLSISKARRGLLIYGDCSKADRIRVKELEGVAIDIFGCKNEVDGVSCENIETGLFVRGNWNKFANVECRNTRCIYGSGGFFIRSGSNNFVDKLMCSGFSDYGLYLDSGTSRAVIKGYICHGMSCLMSGYVDNWSRTTDIKVRRSGHIFENCRGRCTNEGLEVSLVNCNFQITL